MPYNFRRETPGRLGSFPNLLAGPCIAAIGASATTEYYFGGHPTICWIEKAVISALTVPVGGGTILALLKKYDASANAEVTLSASIDLEALTAKEGTAVPILATLTEAQRTLDTGDLLFLEVTASGTVTTDKVDLVCNTELWLTE